MRFRASCRCAIRTPDIIELFASQGSSLFDMDGDPCGIAAPSPDASQAACIASGAPASSYDGVNDLAERGSLDSRPASTT